MTLFERYRPRDWSGVVAQPKALKTIALLRERSGLTGRAFFISGASGTGKTTIAKLIAAEVADEWSTVEIDATDVTPTGLDAIEREASFRGLGKGGRAYIVNEAHGLRSAAIRKLLVMLERIPAHVVWIFTTTSDGQDSLFEDEPDAHPLLSRCTILALSRQGLAKPFAEYLKTCAVTEGLDGKDIGEYVKLIQKRHNNLRAAFNDIESGCMLD